MESILVYNGKIELIASSTGPTAIVLENSNTLARELELHGIREGEKHRVSIVIKPVWA